ncbi:WhiB family transcriptional regulator [Streptomyces bottropensis]|uniref:WhiB family transcriptional regulator n=1 Tax=Streptomyces bottropensis TaxID=42235 RepID=UPI0036A25316
MTTTTPPTGLPTTAAAPTDPNWQAQAACGSLDNDDFYDEGPDLVRRARARCHQCPVLASCLQQALRLEGMAGYTWGVAGGLTADQRRALRCHILLGDAPDMKVAREITSLRWRHVLYPLRYEGASPSEMAVFLNTEFGFAASPATVRLAVWWLGGKAPVMACRGDGDRRWDWQWVRDECGDVVERLQKAGASRTDIGAYLGVSRNSVQRAEEDRMRRERAAGTTVEEVRAA